MNKRGSLDNLVLIVISLAVVVAMSASFLSTITIPGIRAAGNIYYIDFLAGNDNNDGKSTSTPWKHAPGDSLATGNPASINLQAGDIVYFKKGVTYQGKIETRWSGSSNNPITYSSTNWGTGDAVIDGTDNIFVLNGADYIIIENLKLISTTSNMIDLGSGQCDYVTVQNNIFESNIDGYAIRLHYCSNLDINNNQIHMTNGGWGILTLKTNTGTYSNNLVDGTSDMTNVGDGIVVSGSNLLIENNEVYDLMGLSVHADGIVIQGDGDRDGNPTNNVIIRNNKVKDCTQCIYLDAIWGELQNVKVYNNVVWSTPSGESIWQVHGISIDPENCAACSCGSGCGYSMPGLEVYHNTVYVNGMGLGDGTRNAPNIQMGTYKNNLIIQKVGNNELAYRMRDNPPPIFNDVDNNWVYSDGSGQVYKWISPNYDTPSEFCSAANHECSPNSYVLIESNPGQSANFVNLASYDFHPTSSSPFIDKGVSYAERTTDADGNSIIGAPDIGAYEYGGVPGTTTTTIPGSTTTTTPQGSTTTTTTIPGNYDYFCYEAENGVITSPMIIVNGIASNNKYIHTTSGENGYADFTFTSKSSNYIAWALAKAGGSPGASNSFYVLMDSLNQDVWDMFYELGDYPYTIWTWDRVTGRCGGTFDNNLCDPRVFNLVAGSHTLRFRGREALSDLDKIVITNDMSYNPSIFNQPITLSLNPNPTNPSTLITATFLGTSCFGYSNANLCDSNGCNSDGNCIGSVICTPTLRDSNNNLYCTFTSSSNAGDYMYYGCVDSSSDNEILKIPSWGKPPKKPVVGKTPGSGDVIQPK